MTQKKPNEISKLTFVYVLQTLMNEAIPCSGTTTSTRDVTDEQLARSPVLGPSNRLIVC